jgi:UDP-N-acetyl-D-glucosamine dehydrogenase
MGLGYVGLPLAVAFAEQGHDVVGVDIDARKIEGLSRGVSHIEDIPSDRVRAIASRLEVTTRGSNLSRCDAVLVCVPTPLTPNREPDLGPLVSATRVLAEMLQRDQLIVLESGLVAGRDFFLAYSPERVDPGRTDYTLRNTPKVIAGLTEACTERAEALYREVCDEIVRVSSPEAAELTKLLENIFRSVNIAMVNEIAMLTDRMGIDIWEVVDAAATKPYGFMRFDPGPGMGGHCLPVDPFYLSWRAREFDLMMEFIELAGKINQQMPYHCVSKVEHVLNDAGKAVNGARISLFGVSYKPGVGDLRQSPALKIAALLGSLGADVAYHDPYVPAVPDSELRAVGFEDALERCDLAVIVTAHPGVEHDAIAERAPLVLDLRGVTRGARKTVLL